MMFRNPRFQVLYRKDGVWEREDVTRLEWNGGVPVVSVGDVTHFIDYSNTFLLEATGMFDKMGTLIFHGDIVVTDDGDVYQIIAYWGGFWAQRGEEEGLPLSDEFCLKIMVKGDVVQDPHLLQPVGDVNRLLEADKRAFGEAPLSTDNQESNEN